MTRAAGDVRVYVKASRRQLRTKDFWDANPDITAVVQATGDKTEEFVYGFPPDRKVRIFNVPVNYEARCDARASEMFAELSAVTILPRYGAERLVLIHCFHVQRCNS